MQKRTLKVAVLAVLTVVLVLGMSTVAFADQTWSDLPDYVTAKYGVTDNQVAAISEGFPDGTWRPFQSVTRAQFTKMAVAAFSIPLVTPAVPSYTDVPASSLYYPYIEGAKAAGVVNGTSATTFSPNINITRQQALAIVARYVADANGYDLATMYTAAEIDALLAHFGDAASISADLKDEMAFAYDFGITKGDDFGNLNPLANLTRIQGAVILIRAQAMVPPEMWTAAKIELVDAATADKAENLIGTVHMLTYKVTTADGHPAKNVLVDFDTLVSNNYYVGNVSNEAAMTDSFGEVTVSLISTEPGTQRVSATVAGVGTIYTTKYWLALDEVYLLCEEDEEDYEYNAGTTTKDLCGRAVVFGPGPLSTSAQDWYNAYMPNATGALAAVDWPIGWIIAQINQFYRDLLPIPGEYVDEDDLDEIIEWAENWADDHQDLILGIIMDPSLENILTLVNTILAVDRWSCAVEALANVHGYMARGLAGVMMYWDIINVIEDNPKTVSKDETVPSVGDIVEVDGLAMPAAKSAVGVTDATGLSCIKLMSEQVGQTRVQVVADYPGNPYPGQLFNHITHQVGLHFLDWDDQPYQAAIALFTWIPHVIGGDDDGPISAENLVNNTGEVEEFVLDLQDVYGNPIAGYTVVWWIEGVGFFKTDDSSWAGIGEANKDFDITDVAGMASVWVKSLVPGQTVVHCKVMDKYGSTYKEWNLTKQWYSIDMVNFIDKLVWVDFDDDGKVDYDEMVPPENAVDTGHTFTVQVTGAKWVHILWDVNRNGLLDDQALLGKRADIKAAEGYVAVMIANVLTWVPKDAGDDILPGQAFCTSLSGVDPAGPVYTRFADTELSGAEFWADILGVNLDENPMYVDYIHEVWTGLAGKNVYFFTNIGMCPEAPISNTPLPTDTTGFPIYVGTITDPTANPVVTDDMGKATVSINSTVKGIQYVYAVADYTENPQDGNPLLPVDGALPDDGWMELRWDCATKYWEASGGESAVIWAQGVEQADLRWANPVLDATRDPGTGLIDPNPNVDRILVSVFDQYGNALEGYKVTFEIVGQGTATPGTVATYHPFAHFADEVEDTGTPELEETPNHDWDPDGVGPLPMLYAGVGDLSPFWNPNFWWGTYAWLFWDANSENASGIMTDADMLALDDGSDDDYAWGYTLNHSINFTLSEASAAYADLVLDETLGELVDNATRLGADTAHFTSIVNIKIYRPNGTFWQQFEITKVWSDDTPYLASISLTLSYASAGPWYTAYGPTSIQPVYYRMFLKDQYGDPYTTPTDLCLRASGGSASWTQTAIAVDGTGMATGMFTPTIPAGFVDLAIGTWNFLGFDDAVVADDLPSPGEVKSNIATYTIQ